MAFDIFNKKQSNVENDDLFIDVELDDELAGEALSESEDKIQEEENNDSTDETVWAEIEDEINSDAETAEQKEERRKKAGKLWVALLSSFVALIAAAAVFAYMLNVWEGTNIEAPRATVYVTTQTLDKYTDLGINEVTVYFTPKSVEMASIPVGAITNKWELVGLTLNRKIPMNSIVTGEDFVKTASPLKEGQVLVTLPAASIVNASGGGIKSGSKVILSYINKEGQYVEYKDVVIYKCLNGNGEEIPKTSDEKASMYMFNVNRGDVEALYAYSANGGTFINLLVVE